MFKPLIQRCFKRRKRDTRHHYRVQIRCQDRRDMEQVMGSVDTLLVPFGLQPAQAMVPLAADGNGRDLLLTLTCLPSQRPHLRHFVHQVALAHPVRWFLRP